jgi:hypothetical protein
MYLAESPSLSFLAITGRFSLAKTGAAHENAAWEDD